MRCWTWFLSAALLAAVAIAPVLAAEAPAAAPEAKKADEANKAESPAAPKSEAAKPEAAGAPAAPATPKPAVEGDLAIMVRECKLTDEQVTKLTEAATAIMTQLGEWQKTNADKLAAFQKAFQAAQASKDEAALLKARTDAMPIFQERMNVIMKGQKGMLEILTPEQRGIWIGFIAFRQLMVPMAQVDLTGDQLAKIREICNAAAKDIDGIKDEGETGMAALVKIRTAMLADIRGKVLTAEQWAKLPRELTEPPAAPPAGAAPAAADPKAPAKDSTAPETTAPAAESKAPASK